MLKDTKKKYKKEYGNQPCCYKGEILTLNALDLRFRRAGVEQSKTEAKKYLILQFYQSKSLTIKINNNMILSSDNFIDDFINVF